MERPPDERGPGEATPQTPHGEPGPQSPHVGSEQPTSRLPQPISAPGHEPYVHGAPGYPPPGAYYAPPPAVPVKTNGFAVASLVLGILWLYWIGSILALIFGMIAKSQIDQSGGYQQGRGLAIAGIVLGWVGVGFLILFILFFGGVAGCGALLSS